MIPFQNMCRLALDNRNNNIWRTVRLTGEKVQLFSNPEVKINGIPTGNETNNNARVLKEMMNQVANYRDSVFYNLDWKKTLSRLLVITNWPPELLKYPNLYEENQ